MKKILVSGGAGFIGSHLCTRLIKDGHEVICLDNLFTGSEENIVHLKGNPRFEFVLHDVELPYEAKVDEIYNLACRWHAWAGPAECPAAVPPGWTGPPPTPAHRG